MVAYAFVRNFDVAPPFRTCMEQHYLLCASHGALRLTANAQTWLLPPTRAALIAAGVVIEVEISRPVTTSSVLFSTGFAPRPAADLSVFDLSPLARSLIDESTALEETQGLTPYAEAIFKALVAVTWKLAKEPIPINLPAGRSPEVRRALQLTEGLLSEDPDFGAIAAAVGLSPRSLARRFELECAMTWRAVVRRMRVLRAVEELAAGEGAVTAIAHAVGYGSLSAFNAAFLDLVGATPSEYRSTFR